MNPYLIITIQRGAEQHDIEVSAEMTVEELCKAVTAAYGWDRDPNGEAPTYLLLNQTTGRRLNPADTLGRARVWNGARVMFQLQTRPAAPRSRPAQAGTFAAPQKDAAQASDGLATAGTPVVRWQPLDGQPAGDSAALPGTGPGDNEPGKIDREAFTWKRLD